MAIGDIAGTVTARTIAAPSRQAQRVGPASVWMVQTSEPALGIQEVVISADAIISVNGVTYFTIKVTPENDGTSWHVSKRYSDFLCLAIGLQTPGSFPRKHLTGCAGTKLEKRREKLEKWLRGVLHQQKSFDWMRPLLREFLRVDEVDHMQLHAADSPAVDPLSQETAASGTSFVTLQIEIPSGVQAGQALQVTVPDGRQALVTVPEGYAAGMAMLFEFNAEDGTLALLA